MPPRDDGSVMPPFQGLWHFDHVTQGVALGWIMAAPLGLRIAARVRRGMEANRETPALPEIQTQPARRSFSEGGRRRLARRSAGALGCSAAKTKMHIA